MPKKNEELNLEENEKKKEVNTSKNVKDVKEKILNNRTKNNTNKNVRKNVQQKNGRTSERKNDKNVSKKIANKSNKNLSETKGNVKKVDFPTDKKDTKENLASKTKKEINSSKIKESSKTKSENVIAKTVVSPEKNKEPEKVKEATIIEKIKSFIAKIIAMQEEDKKEEKTKTEAKDKKAKKVETKVKDDAKEEKPTYLTEYYDLPYRYNETVVKILAQTPKRLFVYWDVSDSDKQRYKNAFGDDFFEKTYPVLLVHNEDKNYVTEIQINDFANSWYIDINDPKTKYTIQLGRKFRELPSKLNITKLQEENIVLKTDYLPLAVSNELEAPNDHILFEKLTRTIKFRNIKTYEETEKPVSELKTQFGRVYNIKDFYKEMYKEEVVDGTFDLNNPTSGGMSGTSFQ